MTNANILQDRRWGTVVAIVAAAGFLSAPIWAKGGFLFLMGILAIQIAFAVSFNLIFGLTGLVSFGHAAYFAPGAYIMALLLRDFPEIPAVVSWFASGLAAGVIGTLIGFVALRRASGIYFAILTLALGELIYLTISKTTMLGREDGFTGIPRPSMDFLLFHLDTSNATTLYLVIVGAVILLIGWMALIWYGPLGRTLGAIRQAPDRAVFLGIDVARLRLVAFIIAAIVAGLAGGLYAPWAQLITPDIAHWTYSALPILFCLLGGSSSFWGPVLGGLVFVGLQHATRNLIGLSELIVGSALLFIVLAGPGGIIGFVRNIVDRFASRGD